MTPPPGGGPGPDRWDPNVERAWRRLFSQLATDQAFVARLDPSDANDTLRGRLARALRPTSATVVEVPEGLPSTSDPRRRGDVWWLRWSPGAQETITDLVAEQRTAFPPVRGMIVVGGLADVPASAPETTPVRVGGAEAGGGPLASLIGEPDVVAGTGAVTGLGVSPAADAGSDRPTTAASTLRDPAAVREALLYAHSMARLGDTATGLERALAATDAAFSWPDSTAADQSRAAALATLARIEALAGDHAAAIEHTTLLIRLPGSGRHIDRGLVTTMVDLAGHAHDPRALLELADELEPFLTLAAEAFGDPRAEANREVRNALASLYERAAEACENLGETARAEGLRHRCLELRQQEANRDPESLTAVVNLARATNALGRLLLGLGRPDAQALFEQSLIMRRRQLELGGDPVVTRRDLAGSYVFLGDAAARDDDPLAAAFYEEAVAIDRALANECGPDPAIVDALCIALGRLARERRRRGQLDDARRLAEEVLDARRVAVATDERPDPLRNLKVALGDLAAVYRELGLLAPAAALRAEALVVARRLMSVAPDWALPLDDLAVALSTVANDREQEGDLEAALELLDEAGELTRRFGVRAGPTARALDLLAANCLDRARVLRELGRFDREGSLHDEAVALRREAIDVAGPTPERRQHLARALNGSGATERRRHGPVAAAARFDEAAGIFRDLLGTTDPTPARYADLVMCLINLGNTQLDRHHLARAEATYREAYELQREAMARFEPTPAARRSLSLASGNLALACSRQGRLDDAIALMTATVTERQGLVREGATVPRRHALAVSAVNLAALTARRGQPGDAAVAVEIGRTTLGNLAAAGPERPSLLEVARGLAWAEGLAAYEAGDPERAEPALNRAVQLARSYRNAVGGSHSADRVLVATVGYWARAVLDAVAPLAPPAGPTAISDLAGHRRLTELRAALDEALAADDDAGATTSGPGAAALGDTLALSARAWLLAGDVEAARLSITRALSLLPVPSDEVPDAEVWRWTMEALTVAVTVATVTGDAAGGRELCERLGRFAARARTDLPEVAAVQRGAITADLVIAHFHARFGDATHAAAVRRRATTALTAAEAAFATPEAWAGLRAALDA